MLFNFIIDKILLQKYQITHQQQIQIMQTILNFINDANLDQTTQKIINGQVDYDIIDRKVAQFNSLNLQDKQVYMVKLNQRLKQIKKPHKLLSVLLLIHFILESNPNLKLPPMQFGQMQNSNQKQSIVFANMISYYHYFLCCNDSNKFNVETINIEEEIYQAQSFCQLAILKMTNFLKIQFIFNYSLIKLDQHKILLKAVMKSILQRFREDLLILTAFTKNNAEIILQRTIKHPLVYHINYIYEKLIFLNKNLYKLERFNKIIQTNIVYPRFQIDLDLNKQIQMEMLSHQQQRKNLSLRHQKQMDNLQENYELQQKYNCTAESFLLFDEEDKLF